MVKYIGGEWQLTEYLRRMARVDRATGVQLGIGDDCAIYRPGADEELLLTTDLLIESVHFLRATHSAEDAGWKALARGLSDIASMGGEPRFCLVSLAAGPWTDRAWIHRFYRGLLKLGRREGALPIGGDLARAAQFACDIIVGGGVPRGTALRRDGAHPGDAIYVSGALGGSALGLATQRGTAWKRHLRPEPRLALGRFLRRLRVTSCMDLSDGLSLDLRRLCLASGLSAEIAAPPLFRGASLEQALHGGEDYELLFTAAGKTRVPPLAEGVPLTRIGTMRKGRAGTIWLDGVPLEPLGYDHFRK